MRFLRLRRFLVASPSPLAGEGRGEGYRRVAARRAFTLTPTLSREGRGGGKCAHRQSGLTLVEMMVALVISLLLLAGLVTVFASMRSSFSTTQELNHLVNQQRLASTVLSDTLANAGYYPLTNRTVIGLYHTPTAAFPAATAYAASTTLDFATDGQVIYGTGATTPGSTDVVATRMLTAPGSAILNCQGNTIPAIATDPVRWINVFSIDPDKNQLMCTVIKDDGSSPSSTPLIGGDLLPVAGKQYGGVNSLIAVYGVDTDGNGSVDRYMSADTLNDGAANICPDALTGTGNTSKCWPYVRSVRITLGFVTALDSKTLYLTRNVVLANAIGRNVNPGGGIVMTPTAATASN
ncbi:MAG: PilW family protein [Gammaproteobacteria bacterium]